MLGRLGSLLGTWKAMMNISCADNDSGGDDQDDSFAATSFKFPAFKEIYNQWEESFHPISLCVFTSSLKKI